MEMILTVIDFTFKAIGASVVVLLLLRYVFVLLTRRKSLRDPLKGLTYGSRSKKPLNIRIRKKINRRK